MSPALCCLSNDFAQTVSRLSCEGLSLLREQTAGVPAGHKTAFCFSGRGDCRSFCMPLPPSASRSRSSHYFPISALSRNITTDFCYGRGKTHQRRQRDGREGEAGGIRRSNKQCHWLSRAGHAGTIMPPKLPSLPSPVELTIFNFTRRHAQAQAGMSDRQPTRAPSPRGKFELKRNRSPEPRFHAARTIHFPQRKNESEAGGGPANGGLTRKCRRAERTTEYRLTTALTEAGEFVS